MKKKMPAKTCRTDSSFKEARRSEKFKELVKVSLPKKSKKELGVIKKFMQISQHLMLHPEDLGHPQKISEATGVSVPSIENYFRKNHALSRDDEGGLLNFETLKGADIIGRVLTEDGEIMINGLKKIKEAIKGGKVSIPQLAEIVKLSSNRYLAFSQNKEERENPISKIPPKTILVLAKFIEERNL